MKERFRIAICQTNVVNKKSENIEKALKAIEESAKNKAELIVLPEMFNCPYSSSKFKAYAESEGRGQTLASISEAAKALGVYIVAGSIPEISNERIYNTSFIFDRTGKIIGKHRKMHLFDINIPDKIVFKESDILAKGNKATVVDTEMCRIGVAICYDMRFPELLRLMVLKGAELIVIPAAFNMVTGPAHWELLIRTRALDNQVYVAAASPARDCSASYVAYGNSMVADPWGRVVNRAGEKEEIIYADIDRNMVRKVRNELPLLEHRRLDIYELKEKYDIYN